MVPLFLLLFIANQNIKIIYFMDLMVTYYYSASDSYKIFFIFIYF